MAMAKASFPQSKSSPVAAATTAVAAALAAFLAKRPEDPDLVENILLQSKRDGLRNERVYGQQAT
jgi:hypothetical protein